MLMLIQGKKRWTLTRAGLKTTSALFCSSATEALKTPSTALRADSMELEQAVHVIPVILTWILLVSSSTPSSESRSHTSSKSSELSTAEIFRPAGKLVSCKFLTPEAIGVVSERGGLREKLRFWRVKWRRWSTYFFSKMIIYTSYVVCTVRLTLVFSFVVDFLFFIFHIQKYFCNISSKNKLICRHWASNPGHLTYLFWKSWILDIMLLDNKK